MRQLTVLGGCGGLPEAGHRATRQTGARRLMLTHFRPGNDRAAAAAAAAAEFGADVLTADAGRTVQLGPYPGEPS